MLKRIFYLIGINIAIIITFNILIFVIERVFGIVITPALGNYQWLILFAAVFGFGGALTNLMISKRSAKRLYNIQLIDSSIGDKKLRLVYATVEEIAFNHKIEMPEVGYYESGEVNAFATGASKNSSLVAVSTGLFEVMNDAEIKGVIWHEMAHILNGDMVTSTLLQWSLNTFTIVIARIVWGVIDGALRSNDNERGWWFSYYIIVSLLDVVFGMLAGLVLMAHSRQREYKADAGSVSFLTKHDMLSALRKLANIKENPVPSDALLTSKFSGGSSRAELWSSHPPIEKRISAVEKL
jgi:heat shock protein HtpX